MESRACTRLHARTQSQPHYSHAHSHTCTRMGTIRTHTVTLVRGWALYARTQSHLYTDGHARTQSHLYAHTQSHLYADGHYTHSHLYADGQLTHTLVRGWALYARTQSHLYADILIRFRHF